MLRLRDRSGERRVNVSFLRGAVRLLLERVLRLSDYDVSIRLVGDEEMAALNGSIMSHEGTTDVITLDYAHPGTLAGEIYICLPEARRQSRRFKTTWQRETARYVAHGVLHMMGYDDRKAAGRRRMKARENACVEAWERVASVSRIGRAVQAGAEPPGRDMRA
jgi:probable rRNA maturation factor